VCLRSSYISPTGKVSETIYFSNKYADIDFSKARKIRETPGVVSPAYLFPGGHAVATEDLLVPWLLRGSLGASIFSISLPRRIRKLNPRISYSLPVNISTELKTVHDAPWLTKQVRRTLHKCVQTYWPEYTIYLLQDKTNQRRLAIKLDSPQWANLIFDYFGDDPICAQTTAGLEFIRAVRFIEAVMDACRAAIMHNIIMRYCLYGPINCHGVHHLGTLTHTPYGGGLVFLHLSNTTRVYQGSILLLLDAPKGPMIVTGEDGDNYFWRTAPQSVGPADNPTIQLHQYLKIQGVIQQCRKS